MTTYNFKKKILPHIIKIIVGLGLGLLVLLLSEGWIVGIPFLSDIDLLTIDLRYQSRYKKIGTERDLKNKGDVVIVGISDDDLKGLVEPFPFPRDYYAHVVENLNLAGARVVVFDITFESPGKTAYGDSVFRATLQRFPNVVLATKVETQTAIQKAVVRSTEPTYDNIFFNDAKNIGVVNIHKDRDDICRSYFPMLDVRGWLTPTLAFAALNAAYNLPPLSCASIAPEYFIFRDRTIPKYDETSFLLNYYGPVQTFRYVPFSQVIDDSSFQTKDELELGESIDAFDEGMKQLFKNKIVIIGSLMAEERDYHNIPLYVEEGGKKNYTMHGVEIHATAIQNVIDNSFIKKMDATTERIIVLSLGLFSFLGFVALKQIRIRRVWLIEIGTFIVVILLIGVVVEVSLLVFTSSQILMNVVNPSLTIVFAYVGAAVYQYLIEREQKALIKNVFSHYINPAVVNELVANPEKAKLGGDRRELTVFFADIANFTNIAESYHNKPEQLVEFLNEYLDEMTRIILKYDGTLDKYEGDAIMAFWGAPLPQDDHALRACMAAIEMQHRLAHLRLKWTKEHRPPIESRIGINTGVMIVGNMGGRDRFDYTVIGDSVNLASRLEGANKQYQSKIMISEFTYDHVRGKITARELDLIQVKGKSQPVKVFEALGPSPMEMTPQQKESLELYHEGLRLYRERKWDEAIAYMEQALTLDKTCYVAQLYIERAQLYKITPPPDDWNGVFIMTMK
ncbi:MAG: CHASE2 domain-containing protein [Bacteroidetes bacterium]|nr:CHASE2 domain-containing protein [Bacteroidota bacterium]